MAPIAKVNQKVAIKLVRSEYDPETGMTEEFWYEETPGNQKNRIHIRKLQDVEDILNINKEQFNSHSSKMPNYGDSGGNHQVARIPLVLIDQWMSEGFNWYRSTDKERKAKLNNIDYRKLLVRPGKL